MLMVSQKAAFFRAVTRGDFMVVLVLLQENPSLVFEKNIFRQTGLHLATLNHRDIIVETLLHHQADPNSQDMHGMTPLHYAAEYGETIIVRMLKAAHANLSCLDKKGHTPGDLIDCVRFSQNLASHTLMEEDLARILPVSKNNSCATNRTWLGFFYSLMESMTYILEVFYYAIKDFILSLWLAYKKPIFPRELTYPIQTHSMLCTKLHNPPSNKYATFEEKRSQEEVFLLSVQTRSSIDSPR